MGRFYWHLFRSRNRDKDTLSILRQVRKLCLNRGKMSLIRVSEGQEITVKSLKLLSSYYQH